MIVEPRSIHTITMQNSSPMYEGSYLSQPFKSSTQYPDSIDEFNNFRIGQVQMAKISSRLKEKHLKIWGQIWKIDFLTTPLSDLIKVAEMLYILQPYVNADPEVSQEQADIHHAFFRLMELWGRFDKDLSLWAKEEVGPTANAADGLSRLEEARFLPGVERFTEVLRADGEDGLPKDVEEFVTTTLPLTRQIEYWLTVQKAW